MAQSFSTAGDEGLTQSDTQPRRKVLVTGAAGNIGAYFAEHSHKRYELRLMVRSDEKPQTIESLRPFGQVVEGDLDDLQQMKAHCAGIDTVLHLAASAGPESKWADLLPNNLVGTYHIFAAAKSANCRRVIFASSIHAVSGYPADYQVHTTDPVNPGDLYGVSKCFGEALARYMAEQEGLSAIAIRIGAFQPLESARSEGGIDMLDAWVSRRDLNQLIERCIDQEGLKFAVLHGLSNNRFKRLDLSDARDLVGYAPQDDLTREHPSLRDLHLDQTVRSHSKADGGQKSGLRDELAQAGAVAKD